MSEPWWREASRSPRDFRDPESVASLVAGALSPDEETREEAAGALSRVVKALEEDPIPEALRRVEDRLPELADWLVDANPFLSGQVISVMRRVRPNAATVERLLAMLPVTPPTARPLLVEALGLCADAAWSDRVERALVEHLRVEGCADAAERALRAAAYRRR